MLRGRSLFSGELGKAPKIFGSHFMSIPHTRLLREPSYDLGVYLPGEFVCCSLDGRLWIYKHITSTGQGMYTAYALRWNETTGRMEFPLDDDTQSFRLPLSGEMLMDQYPIYPVSRGLDWVLFTFFVVQVQEAPPYIVFSITHQLSPPGIVDVNTDRGFLYSPHRSAKYLDPDDNKHNEVHIGGGYDPFTHNKFGQDGPISGAGNSGYFSTGLGHLSLYPAGEHKMDPCYSTLPSLDDWIIIEDFLLRRPSNPVPAGVGEYSPYLRQARALIPLELNWYGEEHGAFSVFPSYGTGYSHTRRGVQVAECKGKLYGRGLMHMGEAFLIPAAFFEDRTEPSEYYLLITNSEKCIGPHNLFVTPNLDEEAPWMSLGVAELTDIGDAAKTHLIGVVNESDDPLKSSLCKRAKDGQLLVPDDPLGGLHGVWKDPRKEDVGALVVDPLRHTGLALGQKGMSYLGVNAEFRDVEPIEDFQCVGIRQWVAPTGCLDLVTQKATLSSDDNGATATYVADYFDRLRLHRRLLPLAHGIFEKKDPDTGDIIDRVQLSFGEQRHMVDQGDGTFLDMSLITVNELSCPEELTPPVKNIPWNEVFRNPFRIEFLRMEENNAFTNEYRTGWFTRPQANSGRTEYEPPCIPILYKSVSGGEVEFAYINPETAEIEPATYDFGNVTLAMFPVQNDLGSIGARDSDGNFIPMNSPLPSWLREVDDWRRADDYNGLPGEDPMRLPGLRLESRVYLLPSGQSGNGVYPFYGYPPNVIFHWTRDAATQCVCLIEETSARFKIALRHSHFGMPLDPNGYNSPTTGLQGELKRTALSGNYGGMHAIFRPYFWNPYTAYHYLKDPVENYRGKRKYLKAFVVWGLHRGDNRPVHARYPDKPSDYLGPAWMQDHIYFFRLDLDPSVLDFDEELKRSKVFVPQAPQP